MISFPLDPTPFVVVYVLTIFFLPWFVFMQYLIRQQIAWSKAFLALGQNPFSWREPFYWWKLERIFGKQIREQNPVVDFLGRKVLIWSLITLMAWLLGIFILGGTLFYMDKHNLLINHSKSIYGRDEMRNPFGADTN